jgi:hypothetical protein
MGILARRAPRACVTVQAVTARQPDPLPLPVTDFGLLDGAPSPRAPDRIVFGGWYPTAKKTTWGRHPCRGCGCSQAEMGPCWQCDAMVSP